MRECSAVLKTVGNMKRLPFVLMVVSGGILWLALGQRAFPQVAEKQEATGTVTGHVYCADTNGPARLARVMLEPVSDVNNAARPGNTNLASMNSIQTGLDGSFTMKGVKLGVYYVIAEMPGYLSSLSGLSEEEWGHPTAAVADRMAKALQRVSVDADRVAIVNLSLERGAAVSGTVSFDDGSPAAGVRIKALRQKSDGSWDEVQSRAIRPMLDSGITTNDLGQYRIAGLTAGHYVIEADLSRSDVNASTYRGATMSIEERSQYSLSFFSGGRLKANKDAAFGLATGEFRPGEDIVIPLSKLHSVSGTVVTASDGRPVNVGDISLLFGDDQKQLARATTDPKTGEFRFYFVPEGHFILKVDAVETVFKKADGSAAFYHFGQLKQPLDVSGDVDGLVLALPEPTVKPMKAANSTQSQ